MTNFLYVLRMETGTEVSNIISPQESNLLIYSSLFFVTNTISAYCLNYYTYSFLFCSLTLTSLMFHTHHSLYTYIIDKIAILSIVLYGAYMIYHKKLMDHTLSMCIIGCTFVLTLVLFCYGYWANCFCYHPNKIISDRYHSLLHLISSIGHHYIICVHYRI
jgi:hypothetical protein